MILQFVSGEPFANGVATYMYRPVTARETAHRIVVTVEINSFPTQAYLDTGAVYLICAPQIADVLGLVYEDRLETQKLHFRGQWYDGGLYRVSFTITADYGEAVEVEVTAFVPRIHPEDEWPIDFICIAGMSGCLERMRFALDPLDEKIYFGDLTP